MRLRFVSGMLVTLLAVVAGCSDIGGPGSPALSSTLSYDSLRNVLDTLPADAVVRVRIRLAPDTALVRDARIGTPGPITVRERLFGRITALDAAADEATLTLSPGLQVLVNRETRIRMHEHDGDDMTFDVFVASVQEALAASPPLALRVEVARAPEAPAALGPDDAFPVATLRFKGAEHRDDDGEHSGSGSDGDGDDDGDDHGHGRAQLRLNVTAANLMAAGDGDCDAALEGCVRLLGLTIGVDSASRLRVGDHDHDDDEADETRFAGLLDCTTLSVTSAFEGSFGLLERDGTIQVSPETRFEHEDGHEGLGNLEAVATACDAGASIGVKGEGNVSADDASVILATEVEFRNGAADDDDDDDDDDHDGRVEFTAVVDSIVGGVVFLGERVVLTDANTEIRGLHGETLTLADLAPGNVLEVRGTLQEDGTVLAERIRIREDGDDDGDGDSE